jgi:hypothetical protein
VLLAVLDGIANGVSDRIPSFGYANHDTLCITSRSHQLGTVEHQMGSPSQKFLVFVACRFAFHTIDYDNPHAMRCTISCEFYSGRKGGASTTSQTRCRDVLSEIALPLRIDRMGDRQRAMRFKVSNQIGGLARETMLVHWKECRAGS